MKPQESIYIDVAGKRVEVVRNPARADVTALTKEAKERYGPGTNGEILRNSKDQDGNNYYWSSYEAVHAQVKEQLRLRLDVDLTNP